MDINSDTDLICEPIEVTQIMQKQFENIEGNTFRAKINTLNKCNCCIRHQTDRPTSWNIYELSEYNKYGSTATYLLYSDIKYGSTSTMALCKGNSPEGLAKRHQEKINKCGCNCRHLIRFMCRQWPNEFVTN